MAVVDTGSSYTLLSRDVWNTVRTSEDALASWVGDPPDLIDVEPRRPLRWAEVELRLQNRS